MAPKKWATPTQHEFLVEKDKTWPIIKAGPGTLKGFYARTAQEFLQRWPAEPDAEQLKKANGDRGVAMKLAEAQLLDVSLTNHTT